METNGQNQFFRGLQQGIMGENFPQDPTAQEDEMWWRLNELVEENAISAEEGQECFNDWLLQRRPDVKIIHLGQITISERARFYE